MKNVLSQESAFRKSATTKFFNINCRTYLCVFFSTKVLILHVQSHDQNGWSKDSGDAQLAS